MSRNLETSRKSRNINLPFLATTLARNPADQPAQKGGVVTQGN